MIGISPEMFKRRKSSQIGEVDRILHPTASKAHRPLADEDMDESVCELYPQEIHIDKRTKYNTAFEYPT